MKLKDFDFFFFLRFVSGEMSTSYFKYVVYFSSSTQAPFSYLHVSRKLYFYRRTRVKPHRITPLPPILMKKPPVILVQYFGANLEIDRPAWIRDNKGPRHILQPWGRCCDPLPATQVTPVPRPQPYQALIPRSLFRGAAVFSP